MGFGGDVGSVIGSHAGDWLQRTLGFKKGGRVPGKKGKGRLAIVHGGEFVLPVGVNPTKEQKAKVARKHKR